MVSTVKFSQFTSGGNLQNNDITVGLSSGFNVLPITIEYDYKKIRIL